jgi:hypothetical protein
MVGHGHRLSDGASLLWRLALDGRDIPRADWAEIADYGDRRAPVAGGHFIDVHYVLAAAMGDASQSAASVHGEIR